MPRKTGNKNILINQVNVRPVNRRNLDIQKWRTAITTAESMSKNRNLIYDIYEEIKLDAHLRSVTEKRINAITNLELRFFDQNNKEVDELNNLINTTYFEKAIQAILEAKLYGFTLLELDWSPMDGYMNQTFVIDHRHVKPELGIVVANPGDTSGISYLDHPFALFAGSKTDLGLYNAACPLVIYKRNNTADWADFNELFGKPYPQGSYTNDETADLLTEAFEKAGFESYMVAPKDAEIKLHQSTASSNDNFRTLREAMNEELSILILGQNLTTSVKQGSLAAADSHSDVESSINNADREFIVKILNESLLPILQRIGYNYNGKFAFVYSDELAIEKRIDVDVKLAGLVPIDDEYFYETYNVPAASKTTKEQEPTNKTVQEPAKKQKLRLANTLRSFFSNRAVLKF